MIDLLPTEFARATETNVVVPVAGVPDLTDPSTGRVAIPAMVDISVRVIEGGPRDGQVRTYVGVYGPRRLKSGAAGRTICSIGWESARNDGRHGYVDRPAWLTALLDQHMPSTPALSEESV